MVINFYQILNYLTKKVILLLVCMQKVILLLVCRQAESGPSACLHAHRKWSFGLFVCRQNVVLLVVCMQA